MEFAENRGRKRKLHIQLQEQSGIQDFNSYMTSSINVDQRKNRKLAETSLFKTSIYLRTLRVPWVTPQYLANIGALEPGGGGGYSLIRA